MLKHNEFAKAMRQADPSIVLIASGLMLENTNVPREQRAKYVGNLESLYGTEADWTGSFLKDCWGNFDIVAEHWYASGGHHWDLEKAKSLGADKPNEDAYVKVDMSVLESSRYAADTVRLKAEEWQGYQKRFPAMVEKKIPLSIDEYAYFNATPGGGGPFGGMTLRQDLAYGMILNEMLRYTDFLTMGAQTTGVALVDFNRTSATMNALGLLYQLYGEQFGGGAIPVALTGKFAAACAEVSRRQPGPAGEDLRQPDLSARHVRSAFAGSQVPGSLCRECDGVGAEVRSERQRRAAGRAVEALAVDGEEPGPRSTVSARRRRWR